MGNVAKAGDQSTRVALLTDIKAIFDLLRAECNCLRILGRIADCRRGQPVAREYKAGKPHQQ
jgi:hypothetical protein